MPFLRFSRDKRGYEHVYLVHAVNRRGKPSRPRILYWYRSPPGVKVGRRPFDEEIQRMLEAQNPGVSFDWKTIVSTPMPPAEPEQWRERRRAERVAKQARQAEEVNSDSDGPTSPVGQPEEPDEQGAQHSAVAPPELMTSELPVAGRPPEPQAATSPPVPSADSGNRKRRRRGGRRHRDRPQIQIPVETPSEPVGPFEPFEPFEPGEE